MGRVLRIEAQTDDPYLAEQVRRVVEASGALLVAAGEPGADVRLVDAAHAAPGSAADGDGPAGGVPQVLVGLAAGRPPVPECAPGTPVGLPADAEPLLRYLAALATPPRARAVGVLGARGGVGASTLAAAIAREAVRVGVCTALVELPRSTGGLDVLLGIEHEPGPRWADLRSERGGFGADALALALPQWHAVRVLSSDARGGPRPGDPGPTDAVRALAGSHDLLVLDMPREGSWLPGEVEAGTAQSGNHPMVRPGAALVLLATCDLRSAAACAVLARELGSLDVRLVVRRRRSDTLHPLEVAEACGLPVTVAMASERGAPAAEERGETPGDRRRGAIARTAKVLVQALGLGP